MPESQTPVPGPIPTHQDMQNADELVHSAKNTPLSDGGLQTAQLLSDALLHDPHHHEAQILRERLHQTFVPRWHFPMLADSARNRAYAQAIAAKVRPGDVVLDIGCGAGLTAMLAARAGAKHVYTCEQQPLIAAAATRVIAANGLSDRITVLPKWSHDVQIGIDMPEPADVVISEIVDTVLLGEGALATLTHAMAALAKPGARAVPEHGTLRAQLVQCDGLLHQWRPATAEGFDLSAFHHLARVAQITPGDFAASGMRALGPNRNLFRFDFTRPDINPARVTQDLPCDRTGVMQAVLVSFDMQLAPGISVTNDMQSDGHWGRTAYLLDHATPATPGDRVTVTAQHDSANLSLSIHLPSLQGQDAGATAIRMNQATWSRDPAIADAQDHALREPAPVWIPANAGKATVPPRAYH